MNNVTYNTFPIKRYIVDESRCFISTALYPLKSHYTLNHILCNMNVISFLYSFKRIYTFVKLSVKPLITFHVILIKTIGKTVFHSVNQIFQYELFYGTNVRSYHYSVMFRSHNEDHVLKVQTKENVALSEYQVNVTS